MEFQPAKFEDVSQSENWVAGEYLFECNVAGAKDIKKYLFKAYDDRKEEMTERLAITWVANNRPYLAMFDMAEQCDIYNPCLDYDNKVLKLRLPARFKPQEI